MPSLPHPICSTWRKPSLLISFLRAFQSVTTKYLRLNGVLVKQIWWLSFRWQLRKLITKTVNLSMQKRWQVSVILTQLRASLTSVSPTITNSSQPSLQSSKLRRPTMVSPSGSNSLLVTVNQIFGSIRHTVTLRQELRKRPGILLKTSRSLVYLATRLT